MNIYNADGSYSVDAIEELNFVLRCRRTDAEKAIDIQLLTWLSLIYDHFGGKPLQIVSGYRNQRKQTSNHFKGRATDIRIEGVSPKQVRAFAETLDRGGMGIGLYPRSEFVHIDVRSPPSYRWVDNSPPNSNAAEKRPPRGWKRKKLESVGLRRPGGRRATRSATTLRSSSARNLSRRCVRCASLSFARSSVPSSFRC